MAGTSESPITFEITATSDVRGNESLFRVSVPEYVSGARVLEVRGFRPGSIEGGAYDSAVAIVQWADDEWSTHMLISNSDRPDGHIYRWTLSSGHYFPNREGANRDAAAR